MPSTYRDPFTGEIKFKDPENTVINDVTGQTASSLSKPAPVAPTSQPDFVVESSPKVEVDKMEPTRTTSRVEDFRQDLENNSVNSLLTAQQGIFDAQNAFSDEIMSAQANLDEIKAKRLQLQGDLKATTDFSEDRLVDIGTIRGEQAQAQRRAEGVDINLSIQEQRAINKLNSYIALRGQQIDSATKAYEFNKDTLNLMQSMAESSRPDVISTQIDPTTGYILATVQNPDGTVTTQKVGEVTPEVAEMDFLTTNYWEANGRRMFYGIRNDGTTITQDIGPADAPGTGGGEEGQFDAFDTITRIDFLKQSIADARKLAGASGKGLWDRVTGWVKGSTDYNRLDNITTTLRTNILQLATDPNIRDFFGPQMSEADVRMMLSTGSTLNPEAQTPTELNSELQRIENLFNKLERAAELSLGGGDYVVAPDGTVVEIVQ